MAELNQIIWSNITWGACGMFFLCLFGLAIKFEWNSQLTPKAWNRPRNVLKNVLKRHKIFGCIQWYPITWFLWARKLTYKMGLDGIAGTGTRDDGWTGPTLKMNLDGVILLKFHRMLFKIGVLATLLSCGVLLPVYTSSVCDPDVVGERECERLASLTDFENLTISHVPEVRRDMGERHKSENVSTSWEDTSFDDFQNSSILSMEGFFGHAPRHEHPAIFHTNPSDNKPQLIDEDGNIIIPPAPVATMQTATSKWIPGISWRHLTTAVCSVIIYIYTCYLLWHEWIDNLALRRIYFLESDHYLQRMQELDDIANLQTKPEDPVIAQRPPFVPHPEMREVPPNVSLYSVLYQLPVSLVTFDTDGENQVDRQLVATVNFFNECVPSQPGYTSSVVAATLIPDAARVAKCWTKWYRLEKKVRMVRYIRKIIRNKDRNLQDEKIDIYEDVVQVFKNSNHAMKAVALKAYKKVSDRASAALRNATTDTTIVTDNGVEMKNLVGADEETKPLVPTNSEDESQFLKPWGNVPQSSNVKVTPQIALGNEDEGSRCDNNYDGSGIGFWQNAFGRRGQKRNDLSLQEITSSPSSFDGYKDKNSDCGDDFDQEVDRVSDEFVEARFIGSTTKDDIELQQSASKTFNESRGIDDWMKDKGVSAKFCGALTHGFKYENYDVQQYAKTISHDEEIELTDIVDGLGIEELSVFAREYAQSSSSPCPLGCFPNSFKRMDVDELRQIEQELWEDIKSLNDELIEARENVIKLEDDQEVDSTMISSAAAYNSDDPDSAAANVRQAQCSSSACCDENDREVVMNDSRSRTSCVASNLRNRGATTTLSSSDTATDVSEPMKDTSIGSPKRIHLPSCPPGRLAKICCGGKYNPCFKETLNSLPKYYGHVKGAGRAFVAALDHPSYAVVTFSSRQAAIQARQFLADEGGPTNSWQQIDAIPIPPLADAPPCNICFCRGCCRPVTLTINYNEKRCRRWSVYVFLFFFCCFYTVPLAFISLVLNPRWLGQFFPNIKSLHDPNNILYRALTGPASGLATTLFMALLPQIFKLIAYYEGTSSSLEMAERKALLFMWYFMLLTAFFGQYLATMLLQWYYHAGVAHITQSLWSTVNTVATLIPSAIAPQWLNWIIIRYGFIWPGGYFFQMNTFLTKIFRLKCLNRIARGGGAGGPTPFRIYVDSGIVLLCVVGLSPMVPIVAPIATMYFMVVQPMLRWLLIFVYRPRYDTGGEKWPLCHQIVISSLILAQILTSVTLALKGSLGGAIFIGCCTFPTFMFSLWTEERFLRPYKDTAFLQTSRLDRGQEFYSEQEREEFRRWLVDCHKASYVPMCLLGSKDNLLTVEPAVVIPKDKETVEAKEVEVSANLGGPIRRRKQKGGIYDRKYH